MSILKKRSRSYQKSWEIQVKIANYFGPRKYIIVPNVSWGLFYGREVDLLVISKAGHAYEVEIKVSKRDILKDKKKEHDHTEERISRLFFAIPAKLIDCIEYIPEKAGVLCVYDSGFVELARPPSLNVKARKLTPEEVFQVMRLGIMRIWSLKNKILEMERMKNEHTCKENIL